MTEYHLYSESHDVCGVFEADTELAAVVYLGFKSVAPFTPPALNFDAKGFVVLDDPAKPLVIEGFAKPFNGTPFRVDKLHVNAAYLRNAKIHHDNLNTLCPNWVW